MDPRDSVTLEPAKCQFCCDTGWTGWEKPMIDEDGRAIMVFIPQRCSCAAGHKFSQTVLVVDK